MKKPILIILFIASAFITGCKKDFQPTQKLDAAAPRAIATHAVVEYDGVKPTDTLSGLYTTPLVLTKNKIWLVDGLVRVKGTTCTIEAGTVIAGLSPQLANGANPGMLVIEQDAKIMANGTADEPIIFTSKFMVDGNSATNPAPGDFGGLIVMGQAFAHNNFRTFYAPEQGLGEVPVEIFFGGRNEEHSSGELSYIRVEYAGFRAPQRSPVALKPYHEIDGISFISVGHGTQVHHIEVANAKTNSFRFSGGFVNAAYLVDIDHVKRGFIITSGYLGTLVYGISLAGNNQQPNGVAITIANRWDGSALIADRDTHPEIGNFTIVGIDREPGTYPNLKAAIHVPSYTDREGITLHRSILLGYNNALLDHYYAYLAPHITSIATRNIFCNSTNYDYNSPADVYLATISGNKRHMSTINTNSYARLTQPFLRRGNVNLVPLSISPAVEGDVREIGAFTDYSRPPSRWGHTKNWFRLYY